MKSMYKILIFYVMFLMSVVIVNSLQVFPQESTLISDFEMTDLRANATSRGAVGVIEYLFVVPEIQETIERVPVIGVLAGNEEYGSVFSIGFLVLIFIVLGSVISRATHSWSPLIISIIGTTMLPVITKSNTFFQKLFTNWNSPALVYLGITLFLGVLIIVIITIVETPAHGRSGS